MVVSQKYAQAPEASRHKSSAILKALRPKASAAGVKTPIANEGSGGKTKKVEAEAVVHTNEPTRVHSPDQNCSVKYFA
jgi:hypothetical protein